MRSYKASSFSEATPEQVWPVLTDTTAWPDRDSGCGDGVADRPELAGEMPPHLPDRLAARPPQVARCVPRVRRSRIARILRANRGSAPIRGPCVPS
jgi:hypothetical protein